MTRPGPITKTVALLIALLVITAVASTIIESFTTDDTPPPTDTVPIGHVVAANATWGGLTPTEQADLCDQYNTQPRAEVIQSYTAGLTNLEPLDALALAAAFYTVLGDNCP